MNIPFVLDEVFSPPAVHNLVKVDFARLLGVSRQTKSVDENSESEVLSVRNLANSLNLLTGLVHGMQAWKSLSDAIRIVIASKHDNYQPSVSLLKFAVAEVSFLIIVTTAILSYTSFDSAQKSSRLNKSGSKTMDVKKNYHLAKLERSLSSVLVIECAAQVFL